MKFIDFNLDYDVLDGIAAMGFKEATPIQEKAIPIILRGKDLIACAQTGTGKTAAFVLPILDKILELPIGGGINTLILVPTRELAQQIDQQIDAMSYFVDVKSIAIYGGNSGENWIRQKKALSTGTDIIIATPGRLIALMQMGDIDFSNLRHLVLDEADRMLDMGFYSDIIKIVGSLPKESRQTLCFSATMPPNIRKLCNQILRTPEQIALAVSQPAKGIKQIKYHLREEDKLKLALHIFNLKAYQSVIVFSSNKEKVKQLERALLSKGVNAKAFHSDLQQHERESLLQDFKNRKVQVLVGTDVLSRGIHIDGVDLVMNIDVPPDPEDYIHRIGRTARASTEGTAITFVSNKDYRRFVRIEKMVKKTIVNSPLPEGFLYPENESSIQKRTTRKSQSKKNKSGRSEK